MDDDEWEKKRKREEDRMRWKAKQEEDRQNLIRQINSLRAEDFPTEPQSNSLSAQIENWQIAQGLRQKPEREGLSPWVKKDLFDAGEAHLNAPKYSDRAWQDQNGNWVEEGLFPGTVVPAKKLVGDLDDFLKSEKEDRAYRRAASSFWAKYKTFYPQDDSQAVHAALRQVQGALSTREMIDIASDENSAFVAAGRIHQLIEAQQSQAQTMQDDNPDDEGRSDGLGSGVASTGHVYTPQQPQERSVNSFGPMGSAMIELQKKMGIRKW